MICCEDMEEHSKRIYCPTCQPDKYWCADQVMAAFPSGLIGIPVHDGGESVIEIKHCPWCGSKLSKFANT